MVLEETGSGKPLVVNPAAGRNGQKWKWVGNSLVSKNNLAIDMMVSIILKSKSSFALEILSFTVTLTVSY